MNRLYKLSGLLTLALPFAALADSETVVSPAQKAEAMRQMRAQQAQAMRAAAIANRHVAIANRTVARREAKILTNVTVAGRVLDESGNPMSNVAVNVNWRTHQNKEQSVTLLTDAQGRFTRQMEVKSPSHVLRLCAIIEGKRCAWKRVQLTDKPLAAIGIRLQPGIGLSGRLLASDGSPLANQTLHLRNIVNFNDNNFGGNRQVMIQQMSMQGGNGEMMIPDALSAKLFRARTDAAGRFTFTGLPRRSTVQIALDKPLLLAQGSLMPVILDNKSQEAGTRIAVRPGSVSVRMIDPVTHKPFANTVINMTSTDFSAATQMMNSTVLRGEMTRNAKTNAQGVATFANLRPGNYYAYVDSRFEKVTVEEGKTVPTITMAQRQEPLKGRILDANGKPVSGIAVSMNVVMKADEEIMRLSPVARFGDFGWEKRSVGQTDKDGYFTLPKTAWAAGELTVRATKGNARAEWTGSPEKINGDLTIKMQPNALITVTGRLIDPQRRLLPKAQFQSLHWTAAPRSFWVSNARTVQLDADGRFKVEGLERGESFSFITGTRSNGFGQMGNVQPNGAKTVPFESPRFSTLMTGQQQDMGDVMVHPLDDPEDLEDTYGFSTQQTVAKFPGLLPAPSQDAVKEAKQALLTYRSLLKTGDMKAAYEMTSRLSPGWSEDYKTYLQRSILRDGNEEISPTLEKSVALRYVPKAVAASLVSGNDSLFSFGVQPEITPIVKELSRSGEWVFLAEVRDGTTVNTGILRKEEGKWRVINNQFSSFSGGNPLAMNTFNGTQPNPADFGKPLPAAKPEDVVSAQKVAELYLHEWAAGRPSALRSLTSSFSTLAMTKPEDFARNFARRIDEGICPLAMDEQPALQPLTEMSLWEQQWMATLTTTIQAHNRNRFFQGNGGFVAPQEERMGNFPDDYAKRGDIALFRYSAQGRNYIISLVRNKNKWSVLEPAFIQSEAIARDIAMR